MFMETPSQASWKLEAWWDYAAAAYLCVKTQQCATNVILNPDLHVLGNFFNFESINEQFFTCWLFLLYVVTKCLGQKP